MNRFPTGTRVVRKSTTERGVVAGYVGASMVVRFDAGGSHSAPVHFGGYVTEAGFDASSTPINDFPALDGRPVTEGHAKVCAAQGHAHHTVDGADTGVCPRCGVVTENA